MFTTINGWTRARMIETIMTKNQGRKAGHADPSSAVGWFCEYEDAEGNRCAAGCFFPDGHPALKYRDGTTVLNYTTLVSRFHDLLDVVPLEPDGMTRMQGVHDDCPGGDPRTRLVAWIEANVVDGGV